MKFAVCLWLGLLAAMFSVLAQSSYAQLQFESEPINYGSAPVNDPIARLQAKIDSGDIEMKYDADHGYLKAVLDLLNVPTSSQMLVFSQTSFQLRKISPSRPRAIYFSDDVYVGWVQNGDVVEISSVDPQQGAIFYTLEQARTEKPHFVRDRGQCLTCHASSRTQGVPGHLVRSVYPDLAGRPLLGSGTFTTKHSSPFKERWGGWYVSGTHGQMRHMGNAIARDRRDPENMDTEAGANLTDLANLVDVSPYLQRTSDIVALMVLEHQSQMHNFITLANFECRHARHYDGIMNEALDRPADYQSESTGRRIASASEKLVKYMLFAEEFALEAPVNGVSKYAEEFAQLGPYDARGRSLRQFDLHTRLFKYPCSYLIYSEAFDGMPDLVKDRVYQRLIEVLTNKDESSDFAHLTAADRQAVLEILTETKPEFRQRLEAQ